MACTTPIAEPSEIPTAPPPITLQIGIATSATAFAELVAEPFATKRPFIQLAFTPANSDALLTKLAEGRLDAALLHVLPADSPFWFNPVALDGLAIIVHPNNPISDLRLADVQAIFNGRLSTWDTLNGSQQPIALVSREAGSGARSLLQQQVLAEQPIHINALITPSQSALTSRVAADDTSIGYGLMGSLPENVKVVAINGRFPTPNEVGTQNYPLTTPLYFVSKSSTEPEGELRNFLAWLQSPTGQTIISTRYGRVR